MFKCLKGYSRDAIGFISFIALFQSLMSD